MNKIYDELIETDVLIVGAGGAGLRAAIEAHDKGAKVIVVGKSLAAKAHTVMAEGGLACALGNLDPKDNWMVHANDTIKEGQFITNYKMVNILAKEILGRVLELEGWGAIFDRTKDGKIMQRSFGAHTYRRVCHIGDRTGLELIQTLNDESRKRGIKHMEEIVVTSLLVVNSRVIGATAVELKTGKFILFKTKAIILATGGCSRIYRRTSTSQETTGDGFALAYRAGAELMDMEMHQFHPTGMIYPETAEGILVTESVRGEGGILINSKGERFMKKYDPERMELSARDIVAKAIYREVEEGRGTEHGGVYLDITHKNTNLIRKKLPRMVEQFRDLASVDITKEKMEVAPTAHYMMGGIRIEPDTCMSRINGLFAAGEVAAGVHGANRLGGNSLADIMVFGRRTGLSAAKYAKRTKYRDVDKKVSLKIKREYERITSPFKKKTAMKPHILKNRIREIMWDHVGIVRNEKNLKKAFIELKKIEMESKRISINGSLKYNINWLTFLNVNNMLIVCEAIVRSALARKESRGAHSREDFPNQDDKHWLVNIICKEKNGRMMIEKSKVPMIRGKLKKLLES